MHELSVAQNIIETAIEYANSNGVGKVLEVSLEIGAISGVIPENLEFAWEIAVKETILEGSKLVINRIQAVAECQSCGKTFELSDIYGICPQCGKIEYKIISGKELKIKSIKVE